MEDAKCADCRFCEESKDALICRRFPPTVLMTERVFKGGNPVWHNFAQPTVNYHGWCGEFQPKEPPGGKVEG